VLVLITGELILRAEIFRPPFRPIVILQTLTYKKIGTTAPF